jgi:hypothetical protein
MARKTRKSKDKKDEMVYVEPALLEKWEIGARLGRIIETEAEMLLLNGTTFLMHYGLLDVDLSTFVPVSVEILNKAELWKLVEKSGLNEIPVYIIFHPDGNLEILLNVNKLKIPEKKEEGPNDGN